MAKRRVAMSFLVPVITNLSKIGRMEIGDRIRARRREVGWTQEKLAKMIGVDKSAVAQWESPNKATRRGITTGNLLKAANVLGIGAADLVDDVAAEKAFEIKNPKEIALVELFRRMSPRQRDVHLQLFYASVDLTDPKKPAGDKPNR
jgi:transcriptional regulator with XRE-family HTH domain